MHVFHNPIAISPKKGHLLIHMLYAVFVFVEHTQSHTYFQYTVTKVREPPVVRLKIGQKAL